MKPSELDPDRWKRIDEILDRALEASEEERPAVVDALCAGDDALRYEVETLLDAHRRSGPWFDRAMRSPRGSLAEAVSGDSDGSPAGRLIGPFRLVEEIGRGGMGVVYLAEDTRIGRRVALKVLPPWMGVGPEARSRFVSEARAVSGLDDPNIATLYEADVTDEGQLYLVFAYYAGETLADRIARGAVPPEKAVKIARGIAAGLRAAHEGGIIHRDVKPSNVLLAGGDEVKLLDFGVAKVAGEDSTRSGLRLGTVSYMSPEQATGAPVDERTDLWSLGVVLYEMLTGERPFGGAQRSSPIHSILNDEPDPVESKCAGIPVGLDEIVGTLLRKRRDERYASASAVVDELDAVQSGAVPTGSPSRGRHPGARARTRWKVPAGIAAAAVVAAGAWALADRTPGVADSGGIDRVAVLPLENLTGEADRQVFVDGIHDVLISELGQVGTFDVISRTSVMRYRGTTKSLPGIAAELGVDAVMQGSVLHDADSLAVTVTLWDASPERQLWTASYRRAAGGVYEVASDVARSVAGEIGVELGPGDSFRLDARRRVDPEAYEAYVLGRFHLEQRDRQGFEQARRYLRQAIEIDSTFAPAWTTLAEAYGSATFFGMFRPSETMPWIRSLSERALRLDSTLSEAHRVAAAVELYWEWDWDAAERGARRALELNPSNVDAYGLLSEVLAVRGRYDESLVAIERGSELGRFVPFAAIRPAVVLLYDREFDRAIARLREGLEFFPEFWQGHVMLCRALGATGELDEAISECEQGERLSGRTPMAVGTLGAMYAAAGRQRLAETRIAELRQRRSARYAGASHIAAVHAALGRPDSAFAWLDVALEERDVALVHLDENTLFESLRADPRFDELRRRVGLDR